MSTSKWFLRSKNDQFLVKSFLKTKTAIKLKLKFGTSLDLRCQNFQIQKIHYKAKWQAGNLFKSCKYHEKKDQGSKYPIGERERMIGEASVLTLKSAKTLIFLKILTNND